MTKHQLLPADVAPEEWDVAVAIDRFQSILDVEIQKRKSQMGRAAQLCTPDRLPVYGYDPQQPDFFWFAGQGGFGIQTAPAAAKLAKLSSFWMWSAKRPCSGLMLRSIPIPIDFCCDDGLINFPLRSAL